ncbi:hypothetical protein BT96DRAFT_949407 [Gymnopus androsaceus JB14]|uniref:Fungal-type protein kinase domain-containing protein n=1 Tax=Gymnopus androsaceus JB14 TaxID=1447944 RepID=A0A6A4GK18_9AGAR|nr:hypothetical protein BT96DRAFT_949407 [Gymnopus androsaceus JB14]
MQSYLSVSAAALFFLALRVTRAAYDELSRVEQVDSVLPVELKRRGAKTLYKVVERMHAFSPQELETIPNLSLTDEGPEIKERKVKLGKVLFCTSGIVGTIVVRALCVCHKGIECKCSWAGLNLIMKISFPSQSRESEVTIIKHCTEKAAALGDEWVKKHLPQVLSSFSVEFADISLRRSLMVVRSMQELYPLKELKYAEQFAQVLYDILQSHEWVYVNARVLHRDVSRGNIMYRKEGDQVYGVLNDFDLALILDAPHSGSLSNHRASTPLFMTQEQLVDGWNGPPRFRHGLESLFYVMLLLACNYEASGVRAATLEYGEWHHAQDSSDLGRQKFALTREESWSPPVETFFDGFLPWLQYIKLNLWDGIGARDKHRRQRERERANGIPRARLLPTPAAQVYFDEETLDGHFSYETFFHVMRSFNGKKLLTRNPQRMQVEETR